MRTLILASCLIATICAYHIQQHDFQVKIKEVQYTKTSNKYDLKPWFDLPEGALAPIEEVLKEVADHLDKRPKAGMEAILNEYADKIFVNLQQLMIHNGLDPVDMPDLHTGFNFTLIITYHGELDLTKGWLYDLSTIHRGGDVIFTYSGNSKFMEVTVPIAFNDIQFDYDYSAKIMGLGPTGGLHGKVSNLGVTVKIGFDVANIKATLDQFEITDSGHINLDFSGNVLVDWLLNLLTDVATSLLKPIILGIVENIIRGAIQGVVDLVNQIIDSLLHPTTIPPTVTTPLMMFFN